MITKEILESEVMQVAKLMHKGLSKKSIEEKLFEKYKERKLIDVIVENATKINILMYKKKGILCLVGGTGILIVCSAMLTLLITAKDQTALVYGIIGIFALLSVTLMGYGIKNILKK